MNRHSSNLSLLGWIASRACLLLMLPVLVLAAVAADSAIVPSGVVSTNLGPGTFRAVARVQTIDASKNTFSATNASSVFLVRCSSATLARVGGAVVKASDLKVGAEIVVRGRLEADGSVSASLLASRIQTPPLGMKPATPKDAKGPSSK